VTALCTTLRHLAIGWSAPDYWVWPADAIRAACFPTGRISDGWGISTRSIKEPVAKTPES